MQAARYGQVRGLARDIFERVRQQLERMQYFVPGASKPRHEASEYKKVLFYNYDSKAFFAFNLLEIDLCARI
jgi:hypothetical protein